jgi:hypothetical protein
VERWEEQWEPERITVKVCLKLQMLELSLER